MGICKNAVSILHSCSSMESVSLRKILPTRHAVLLRGRLRKTRGRLRKTRGRLRKIRGRLRKIWGRESKTMRQIGKIGRRKVFPKVKNVNVELLKKRSNLLVFSARSFLFPLHQCSWMGSSKRLSFFGGHELFWLGRHELILFGTRIVHDLFRINETFNEKINGH